MIRHHTRRIALGVGTLALVAGASGVAAQTQAGSGPLIVQTWTAADADGQAAGGTHERKMATRDHAGKMTPFVGGMTPGIELGGKVVTGAPYSAEAITEMTQALADGNRIVRKQSASVARDSQGRTRRDMSLNAIGSWVPEDAPKWVMIHDPVGGQMFTLDEQRQTATRQPLPTGSEVTIAFEGGAHGGVAYSSHMASTITSTRTAEAGGASASEPPAPPPPPPPPAPGSAATVGAFAFAMPAFSHRLAENERQTESLGTQTMEGVEAVGTRTTITIPAGEIGNEQPIRIVSEQWYSPALQTNVLTRRDDPRMGETVYRLTNILLAEPAASLFEVPAGYTITETTNRLHAVKPSRR